jgi:endoglucanase
LKYRNSKLISPRKASRRPASPKRSKRRLLSFPSVVLGGVVLLAAGAAIAWMASQPNSGQTESAATPGATPGPTVPYDGAEARATLLARRNNQITPVGRNTLSAEAAARNINGNPAPAITPATTVTAPPNQAALQKQKIDRQLEDAWVYYKARFIQNDGRVKDPMFGDLTTSEGQSYALLRAVWQNDKETFDRLWRWTQSNLQTRAGDKLFSYKWGKAPDGNWKVLDEASAADAETDITLALIFAWKRWNETSYQKAALEVLAAMWQREVATIQGKPYLTAGEWAVPQAQPTLNPSYLAPYAYRIFGQVDTVHNWTGLVETSYQVIRGCSELDGIVGAKLPPNWCAIDRQTGKFTAPAENTQLNVNYGYDAFRTMWRVAVDYKWFGEKQALDYLKWSDTLRNNWKQTGKLAAEYSYSGKVTQEQEDLAVYGGTLGNFMVAEPDLATSLVYGKLLPAYQGPTNGNGQAGWGDLQNYYNQNWVWFGLALYNDSLPNLAASLGGGSAAPAATPALPVALNGLTTPGR